MKEKNRIDYFDILRGIAIVAVVGIHSTSSGIALDEKCWQFHFTVVWRNLLNFSVPLFLAISGYFMSQSIQKSQLDFDFFGKKIKRVYLPMLFWSSLWFLLSVIVFEKSIITGIYKIFTFQTIGPYYFIALIIQYYLLSPLLFRFADKNGLILSVLISIVTAIIIFYLRYYAEISLPLILYAGNFPVWLMFFVCGMYFGNKKYISISNNNLIFLILISVFLSLAESYLLLFYFKQAGDAVTAIKPSSFLYSLFVIIFMFNNVNFLSSNVLKNIGQISFGIYLTHIFVLMIVSKGLALSKFNITQLTIFDQLLKISLTTLVCYVGIKICNTIFPKKISDYIGFR